MTKVTNPNPLANNPPTGAGRFQSLAEQLAGPAFGINPRAVPSLGGSGGFPQGFDPFGGDFSNLFPQGGFGGDFPQFADPALRNLFPQGIVPNPQPFIPDPNGGPQGNPPFADNGAENGSLRLIPNDTPVASPPTPVVPSGPPAGISPQAVPPGFLTQGLPPELAGLFPQGIPLELQGLLGQAAPNVGAPSGALTTVPNEVELQGLLENQLLAELEPRNAMGTRRPEQGLQFVKHSRF